MKFNLNETAKEHIIVVAHRGAAGGNIPCNTATAYETALRQGADMLEVDLNKTADGVLVIFHPKMEKAHLGVDCSIPQMPYEEVKKLRYVNYDRTPTQFGVLTFDEVLERFKGRCYINVDKFWDHPEDIYKAIKRHGMMDQIVVKSAPSDKVLEVLEDLAPELPFLPIVKNNFTIHEELMKRNINYVGAEMVFTSEDAPAISLELMDQMHRDGKLVWSNSIIYNYKDQLSAGHSDDTALSESPEKGWGWLADRGFDFIQTDWPQMVVDYLKASGKYYR